MKHYLCQYCMYWGVDNGVCNICGWLDDEK